MMARFGTRRKKGFIAAVTLMVSGISLWIFTGTLEPDNPYFMEQNQAEAQNWSYNANVDLMSRTIFAEASGEPYVGQVAVGAVIMNRVSHPRFPNTIPGVIYQPWAFEAVARGLIWRYADADALRAARAAIAGWDPSGGALYYWNPATSTSRWIWSRKIITRIGKHVFGL